MYLHFFIASSQVSAQCTAKMFFKGCDEIQDGLFIAFGSSLHMPEILVQLMHAAILHATIDVIDVFFSSQTIQIFTLRVRHMVSEQNCEL